MAPRDIVTDFRAFRGEHNTDAAHANLQRAAPDDPEKTARIKALADRWGVGVDTARVQQPRLESAARREQDKLAIMDAPKTAAWLAETFDNAAVSHDHVADLARVEKLVRQGFPLLTGVQQRAEDVLARRGPQISNIRGPEPTAANYLGGLYHNWLASWALAREGTRAAAADLMRFEDVSADAQKKIGHIQFTQELKRPAFKTGLASSVYGGLESFGASIPAVAAGVATRNPGVTLGVMGGQTGISSYGKYRQRGGTAGEAALGGALEGGIEAATEAIPMGFLVKRLGKAGFKEFVSKFVGQEMLTEQLATFGQDAVDTAIANPNKTWAQFWEERPQAAFDTLIASGVAAAGFGGVNALAQRIARQDEKAEAAPDQLKAFNDVVKATVGMPLRERAPEQFAAYTERIAEGVDVYVNADVLMTFLQSKPDEAGPLVESLGIAEQLKTASREVDIVIPAALYLQHVAPTSAHEALENDIKIGPGGMSLNEAEEHKAEREQLLAETAARALQTGVDITKIEDPVERVRQHFYDQAVAVGVPEPQARENAAVQAAYYQQRAARNTTYADAWEAYEAANVSMQGQGVTTEGPAGAMGKADAVFNIFEQKVQDPKKLADKVPGLAKVLPNLTEEEREKLTTVSAKNLVKTISKLPDAAEMASVAYAGRAKRGWYEKSAEAILQVFGAEDGTRFAALLAALSPQTSVESNSFNALATWVNWDAAGRPRDRQGIIDVLAKSVQGGKGRESILDAWINNSVRALSAEDPGSIRLSGPKVNSFFNNLVGVVDEVTNDAWMANYALIGQELFKGREVKGGDQEGFFSEKGTGYIAMSAVVRKAADIVSQRTGEMWTPAEVQETVWSWAKTLYEKRDSAGDTTAEQLLQAAGLTHEDLAGTPDFAVLFSAGVYRRILEHGGYGQAIDAIAGGRADAGRVLGLEGSVFSGEGAGIAEPAYQRHLVRAARRIERRRFQAREARFQQADDGELTLSHFSSKGRLKQLDPAMWGENWEVLPDEEKMRVGDAPGRVYWGVGTGGRGEYQPELGIGAHRYEAKVPANRLYDIDADPEGYRQQAQAEIKEQLGEGESLEDYGPEVTTLFEQKIKDAGWLGYRSRNQEIGDVVATFEPVKSTYKGKYAEPARELPPGEPLEGLPRRIKVDGRTVTFGPHEPAREAARAYMAEAGLPYFPPTTYARVDEDRARRIAQAYENMEHRPGDPEVAAAYDAMIQETLAQWEFIKATGLKVEFNPPGQDPYGNPRNAILDVVENNHLWVFPTDEGFGSSEDFEPSDNPLLQIIPDETISGRPVTANDIFRIVHDYFGHIKEGVGFRADGEENAWRVHSAMYSAQARRAMTSETRGQNSWVNFGPHAEANKTASGADTVYADQKIGLLPDWVVEDGAREPAYSFDQSPFPDSKVPQVLYHGTRASFEKFSLDGPRNYDGGQGPDARDTGWYGRGIYFTPSGVVAGRAYTGGLSDAAREGGNVIPAYVNLKNPLRIDLRDIDSGASAMERAVVKAGGKFTQSPTEQAAEAKKLGYDGVTVYREGKLEEVVAFDPKQIASAISGVVMGQGPRGDVGFSSQGALVRLFKSRNASTLIHEAAGHIWLENLAKDAADPNATDEVREDLELIKSWWRANAKDDAAALAAIDAFGTGPVDVEAIRPFHEMFARAAERYFMEGKSPTEKLRGSFARFRQWLVAIYKDFTKLNVPMTDDVRGVFDRLIASEQAVADATVQQHLGPFFPDAEAAGMTDAEYEGYIRAVQLADEAANDRMLGKVMAQIRRKRTTEWNAERNELVEKYQAEVNDSAEMQALSLLENGDVRLQRQALVDMGVDEALLYRRSRPYVYDVGVHPDVLAEQVGMDSGQALIEALGQMKRDHDALRAEGDKRTVRVARAEVRADQEMLARHGDILNDGTIGDEAVAALHDLRRSEVLMAEVRALIRKAGAITSVWSETEMQAWAAKQVAARPLSMIRPHLHANAEAKAGRDALKALVVDDYTAALDAKFRQLLQMHLYRAARTAREEIEKGKTGFDRIVKARNGTISKSRNMDMVSAARTILMPYGFGAQVNDADYMAKVERYDPELWADIGPTVTAALAGAKPVDQLTYDEFVSLRDVVDQLWRMSRTSRQMEIDFQALELEDITNDLADALGNVAPRAINRAPTAREHAIRLVSGLRAALRRVETWAEGVDGGPKGPWRTYVWQPVSEAAARYRLAKADYLNRFVALVAPVQASLKKGKIAAPELGYTFGFSTSGVGKGELLHALLHTGNDSNKRKLLLGRGWAVERPDGSLDSSAWDRFLDRMHREGVVTQADWQFAQEVWNLLEEMKPAAQQTHRRVFGRYFEEVTANPVTTPFGVFKGGYVPALVDTFLVQEQALNAQENAITDANDATMFPSPNRGFTKARVEYNRPLLLDLGLLPGHIDKVLKFTHMTGPVRDVLRLLKEKGLATKLEAYDPVAVPDLLLPWLNRSAKQIIEIPSQGNAGKAADNVFRAIRTRTGMGIMIGNLSNTLQQLTGWAPASLKVRKRFLTSALWRYTRNPTQVSEDVAVMSPWMATRIDNAVHEAQSQIEQLLLDPSKYQQVSAFAQKHAYILQSYTQHLVDIVTWTGAFEQATVEGQDYGEAVRSADSAVRETQGSLAPEDVSRFETGSPFMRVFTQFYNYFGAQSNLLTTELGNARSITRVGYVYLAGVVVPSVVADIIRRSFGEGWDDEDDDGYLDTFLDVFFGSQFRYVTGMVPVAGQMLTTIANRFNDKPYDDKVVPAPAFSSAEQVASIPKDVYLLVTEGKRQKATVRDTATLLTLLTGIPWFNFAARPLGYLADVNEGKTVPTGPVDFARGLATGASSKESKVQ